MHILKLRWASLVPPAPVRQLRRVLRAGLGDPHYGRLLRGAELGSVEAIRRVNSVAETLARLPFTSRASLGIPRRTVPPLVDHPLFPGMRAARVSPGKARYTALAGSLEELSHAAVLPPRLRPQAEFSILALFEPGQPAPGDTECDFLWEAFQVPVYSMMAGFDGAILGWECEARCGLHAAPGAVFEESGGRLYVTSLTDVRQPTIRLETGLRGNLDTGRCECGRPGVRILSGVERTDEFTCRNA